MERVCGSLAHRGPDGKGIWTGRCNDWNVMLGHRRLSIIDLSDAASQPMASADGSCHIVYNGEIYNYIELREELRGLGFEFRTKSDTEVILAAYRQWGADCLNRFNGMWAFAIHDAKKNILFCARDRFGIKPFYCFRKPGLFVFASEIKALLRHPEAPRVANASRVADFLAFGLVDHSPETFFKDIDRLPPAHYMVIEDGRLSLQPYWVPPKAEPAPETDSAESASRFLELFSDAVRIRLRSDVPVGTCLSGGLDSSSIVCVANRIMFGKDSPIDRDLVGERQKTFTACYGNAEFDERPFVDVVTGQTNASSHRVFPEAAILLKDMDALISHQEEPFGSTSIFAQWCVMRKVKETGVKVLLDGQGGDELLAGYDAYYAALAADRLADFRPIAALAGLKKARRLRGLKAKWLAARTAFFLVPDCLKRPLFPFAKGRLVNCIGADFFRASFTGWPELKRCGSYVQGWSRQHLAHTTLPGLLRYEDRNSMAFSIEARVPFLDYRLVEFVLRLPTEQKISGEWTKPVLREAMKGILPEKVRLRTDKKGFETPEGDWFRGELSTMLGDTVSSRSFASRGFFNASAVRKAFDAFQRGRPGLTSRELWRIVNTELWMRSFLDKCERE
jgi:asparagine synthase (glutamine-hydrolysing)